MIKKYLQWKASHRNGKRWLISFAENFLFWGTGYALFDYFDIWGLGETWNIAGYLFKTSFMAFLWTLTTDWNTTKALFSKNTSSDEKN